MWRRTWMLLATLLSQAADISGSDPPSIAIQPNYYGFINPNDSVVITCNADQPLAACQFYRDQFGLIDLNDGEASQLVDTNHVYHGSGLETGDCGVQMSWLPSGYSGAIYCRVRTDTSKWVYDQMSLQVSDGEENLYFIAEPRGDMFVTPGQDLSRVYRLNEPTNYSLSDCNFIRSDANGAVQSVYFGAGLDQGECGIRVMNMTEDFAGYSGVSFATNSPISGRVKIADEIIVAVPPGDPVLTVEVTEDEAGFLMTATCSALNSCPVSNITWYMVTVSGHELIREDYIDDSPLSNVWAFKDNLQNISQTITRRVTKEDESKLLLCQVTHFAIPGSGVTSQTHAIQLNDKTSLDAECSHENGLLQYAELGCTVALRDRFCPIKYDCSNLAQRSKTQCTYKGKTYSPGEALTDDIGLPCLTNIVCQVKKNVPGWTYTKTICPDLTNEANTIEVLSQSQCCPAGTRSSFLTVSEFKCIYKDIIYPIGAQIPNDVDPCLMCICDVGFTGSLEAPWCTRIHCGIELDYHKTMLKGYAPMYDLNHCCPVGWVAPLRTKMYLISSGNALEAVWQNVTCTFDRITMTHADLLLVLEFNKGCRLCTCGAAPNIVCTDHRITGLSCPDLLASFKANATLQMY